MGGRAGGRAGTPAGKAGRNCTSMRIGMTTRSMDGRVGPRGSLPFRFALRSHRLLPLNQSGKGKGGRGGDLDPRWEKNAPRSNVDPEPDL